MATNRAAILGVGLVGAAGAAYLFYRNRAQAGDVLEEVTTTATRIGEDIVVSAREIASAGGWPYPRGQEYAPLFYAAEKKYGIPVGLLAKQGWQESRFRPDIISGQVRSSAGAVGIMQIIPKFHPSIDPGDAASDERAALHVPTAIDYAAKYDAQLFKQFKSWPLAFAAYNWGPGNVSKKLAGTVLTWPSETFNYARDITGVTLA